VKGLGELATTGQEVADTRKVIHDRHAAANHPTMIDFREYECFVILLGMHSEIGEQILYTEKRKEKSD